MSDVIKKPPQSAPYLFYTDTKNLIERIQGKEVNQDNLSFAGIYTRGSFDHPWVFKIVAVSEMKIAHGLTKGMILGVTLEIPKLPELFFCLEGFGWVKIGKGF